MQLGEVCVQIALTVQSFTVIPKLCKFWLHNFGINVNSKVVLSELWDSTKFWLHNFVKFQSWPCHKSFLLSDWLVAQSVLLFHKSVTE